jgi:alpha-galactosidase
MGWNSWNSGIPLSTQTVEQTIDAMVASGMRDAGYRHVNLDAGWAAPVRDATGHLQADPQRFPGGIASLARYAHDRGMYLGLYASPFDEICGQDPRIGSAGHEMTDAHTFADWGVDYLKYDWCREDANDTEQVKYFTAMRDALRASGRRILYSINPNSTGFPTARSTYDWTQIADITRNTADLVPAWGDPDLWANGLAGVRQEFDAAVALATRSGPRHINDPDMLVVGIPWAVFVRSHPTMVASLAMAGSVSAEQAARQPLSAQLLAEVGAQRPGLTDAEQRAHLSLWAMLAAPLIAGNDVRTMAEQTRTILTNREVIAVDQDPLVVQGTPLPSDGRVIVKPLADRAVAVALFNADGHSATIDVDAQTVGLPAASCYTVRDLWAHTDSTTTGEISQEAIPVHGVAMLRVTPACR